nr:unnamed protein product [Spodoptera littoralis]
MNSNQKLIKALSECFTLVSERIMKPWLQNELIYSLTPQYRRFMVHKETIRNHISEIIRIRRKEYEQNIKKGDSDKDRLRTFMELMIESSGVDAGYDDKELLSEIVVIITAATDTSSVGSAFTCVLLARHPDIQEKVYKEIKEVFSDSEPVTFEKLAELKYMSAVIMESLRLYPPAPNVVRKVDRDVILPSGDTLPKATAIMLSIFAANRNPRYWGDDAEEFRPERFMGSSLKHHSAFLSFSSGPRNCVGYRYGMLSMKAALTNILRNFRLLPISEQDLGKPMNLESDLMLRDTDGFQVKLEPRV